MCYIHAFFLTLLIRNLLGPHSQRSNCEPDKCKELLKNMEIFFKQHLDKNVYEEDMFSPEILSLLPLAKGCEAGQQVYNVTSKSFLP